MMRLSRIYASKLYLTSTRKDKIRAAINNMQNVELVQQLSDCLDDEDKELLEDAVKDKEKKLEQAQEKAQPAAEASPENEVPDERNVFSPSYSGGSFAPPSGGFDDFGGEGDVPDIPDAPDAPPSDSPEPDAAPADEPVQESTAIYGEVKADTDIVVPKYDIIDLETNAIKSTLNSRAETAGVQRVAIDDDELWIYYKDEANIGDMMVDVIEFLNASGYTSLAFSRLARSNNAIVFDINLSTQEPIKSIKQIEEENK